MAEIDILKTLFPVGKSRWVKIKYLDYEKCLKAFHLNFSGELPQDGLGYETVALTILDEHAPQVSALLDIRDQLTSVLYNQVDESTLNFVRDIIKQKADELQQRAIYEGEVK